MLYCYRLYGHHLLLCQVLSFSTNKLSWHWGHSKRWSQGPRLRRIRWDGPLCQLLPWTVLDVHTHHHPQCVQLAWSSQNFQNCSLDYDNHWENLLCDCSFHDAASTDLDRFLVPLLRVRWALPWQIFVSDCWTEAADYYYDGSTRLYESDEKQLHFHHLLDNGFHCFLRLLLRNC